MSWCDRNVVPLPDSLVSSPGLVRAKTWAGISTTLKRGFSEAMTFDSISAGTSLFVDANVFVYAVTNDVRYGVDCQALLQRIENQEIQGFTLAHVIAEMAHRLMTIEASTAFGRPLPGMANWLKRHPAEVMELSRFRQAVDELAIIPIQVLPVSGRLCLPGRGPGTDACPCGNMA